jgi:DMSO reductase anchor subunit
MHPAFSVIFLTTLIGVGQGLFLALYTAESYYAVGLLPAQSAQFYATGAWVAVAFLVAGLLASFFHLGHPERAWRAAAKWRTSWLSREVIALPVAMGLMFVYGAVHYLGWDLARFGIATGVPGDLTLLVGALGVIATFGLFLCTAMIYASIRFLQEWASPLTVLNYTLLGIASGFTFASAYASLFAADLVYFFGGWAIIATLAALVTRVSALIRNARIKYKSSPQTAIGVRHSQISQRSQGFMGGSFNTREFFHGVSRLWFRSVKWVFLVLVFPVPVVLIGLGMNGDSPAVLVTAFLVQYTGLLAERWFFFAQANHPQNLYYQTVG